MSDMVTVRYIGWPREELRTAQGDNKSITMHPYGVHWKITEHTIVMIPWTNVIDVTARNERANEF